jgi:SAM-dependent methyltransferase
MLKFVTKADYWEAEESGLTKKLAKAAFPWHLKSVQDAIAFTFLHDLTGSRVVEVGGGNSRILPPLAAAANQCLNIDKFDGGHGGPNKVPKISGIDNVIGYVGDSTVAATVGQCDALFSVSVVEHVPAAELSDFFANCAALLRPGGLMVHLIDVYLTDAPKPEPGLSRRLDAYAAVFRSGLLTSPEPDQPLVDGENAAFSCAFATNPDNTMAVWNRVNPTLRPLRETAQSCSLKMVGHTAS